MTLDRLISRWAERDPDRTAIIAPTHRYSYRDLSEAVHCHTRALEELGAGRGDRLVVTLEPSFEAVALLCACARLGIVWVPVSPENPSARVAAVIAAVSPSAVVGSTGSEDLVRAAVPGPDFTTGHVREGTLTWRSPTLSPGGDAAGKRRPVLDIDPAYVIFTSGSTGTPKGIVMPHRSACGLLEALIAFNRLPRDAVVGSLAPVQFDLWLLDTVATLGIGAAVAHIPRSSFYQPRRMVRYMQSFGVTQMNCVPAVWTLLMRHAQSEVKEIESLQSTLIGGDEIPLSTLRQLQGLLPHMRIINAFGHSESIACSFADVPNPIPPEAQRITFGHGHPGAELLNVDEHGKEIVLPHEVGELYLRTGTLFTGYWNDEETTRAALVSHPLAPQTGEKVFRTGDLVYFDECGNFFFVGRRDGQVQIMGTRTEPGEIAETIRRFPPISDAAVFCVPPAASDHAALIVALCAPAENAAVTPAEIRSWCLQHLPRQMLPACIEVRDVLPLNVNGKVDVARLEREWIGKAESG